MKVLHINCNYIGTTLHQKMIEHLDEVGIINDVFVPTYNKNLAVIKTNSNVVISECFKKWDRLFFYNKSRKIFSRLTCEFKVGSYDLVHAYTLFTDGNVALNVKKKMGIPYVVAVRNTDVNYFLKCMPHLRHRGVEILRNASAVFFLSEAYKRQVFDKYIPYKEKNTIEKKTFVIPNGIDEFWINNTVEHKEKRNRRQTKLIYAGRIDANKNIETTQAAVKELNENNINALFTVVGKIDNEKIYKRIKKDDFTMIFNPVTKEKLIDLYRDNDIFIMPSFYETFGLVYAEAMSQGLPVIYTKGQGFDGQFDDGVVGYSVDPHNPSDIAEKIRYIMEDYSEISRRCSTLSKRFSWSIIVGEYRKIYESVKK